MSTQWPKQFPKITATKTSFADSSGFATKFQRGSDVLWLDMLYFRTVEQGDTIGGYSKILYGNFDALNVWARMKPACLEDPKSLNDLVPLASVNVIRTDEILVHVGEFLEALKIVVNPGASGPPKLRTRKTPNVTLRGGAEIVAADFSWTDPAAVGEYATSGWSSGYVVLDDIPTFVDRVRAEANGRPISLLHIQVHGAPGLMQFGSPASGGDELTVRTLPIHRAKLRELKFNLGSGSWVVARSCKTGASLDLLRALRDLWGVNIMGGVGNWNNIYDFNFDQYVILEAGGAEYYVNHMPTQLQSSLLRKAWKNR